MPTKFLLLLLCCCLVIACGDIDRPQAIPQEDKVDVTSQATTTPTKSIDDTKGLVFKGQFNKRDVYVKTSPIADTFTATYYYSDDKVEHQLKGVAQSSEQKGSMQEIDAKGEVIKKFSGNFNHNAKTVTGTFTEKGNDKALPFSITLVKDMGVYNPTK